MGEAGLTAEGAGQVVSSDPFVTVSIPGEASTAPLGDDGASPATDSSTTSGSPAAASAPEARAATKLAEGWWASLYLLGGNNAGLFDLRRILKEGGRKLNSFFGGKEGDQRT